MSDEDAEDRILQDPEAQPPVIADPPVRPLDPVEAFAVQPDVAERLKESGRDWQKKVEAQLALWLDEASLALRKEGLPGLARAMKDKTAETRRKAESGEYERDVQRLVQNVIGTIGRDIAGAAISAAFAGFGAAASNRTPPREDGGPADDFDDDFTDEFEDEFLDDGFDEADEPPARGD